MSNFDPTRAKLIEDPEDEGLFVVMDKLERTLRNHKEQSAKLLGEATDAFQTAVTKSVTGVLAPTEKALADLSDCVKQMESAMSEGDRKTAHFDALKSSLGRVVKVQRETADAVGSNTEALREIVQNMAGMETRHANHLAEMHAILKELSMRPVAVTERITESAPKPKRKIKFVIERDDYGKAKYVHTEI